MLRTIIQGFTPLKIPNFRTYISGQAVSLIGTWLQITAQSWVVWELSHSEAALGVVAMLGALPIMLLGPWMGVIADRLNRRLILISTQFGMMTLAFVLAALVQFKLVQIWHVYILATLVGVFSALDFPAQQAFLGDLSGMSEVRKAVNMNAMFLQASRMIGPALAGWVIGQWGAATAFWINGISFIVVIASLIVVRASQVKSPRSGNSVFADLWDAMRFLRGQPRMQDLLLLSIFMTLMGLSVMNMMAAFADEQLGGNASTLGMLLGSSGAGALISVVFILPVAQSKQRIGLIMSLAVSWAGLCYVVLSGTHFLWLAMTCMFLSSLSVPMVIAMSMGLIQVLSPFEMRARLLSLFTMVSFGMQPISAIIIGSASEKFGVNTIITVDGILMMLSGMGILLLRKGLREWRVRISAPTTPTTSH